MCRLRSIDARKDGVTEDCSTDVEPSVGGEGGEDTYDSTEYSQGAEGGAEEDAPDDEGEITEEAAGSAEPEPDLAGELGGSGEASSIDSNL